jgi:hypothetical protein
MVLDRQMRGQWNRVCGGGGARRDLPAGRNQEGMSQHNRRCIISRHLSDATLLFSRAAWACMVEAAVIIIYK